ncbi:flavin reductase family protein [Miltoncostaea marina]|uniref:flavin reductase family protein n=1 Tax=Miltoncostaea marina TaxID=2843215 RepID=UPI001C3E143C|nr:flavin reductase family protein [Miltoncostaea marina]
MESVTEREFRDTLARWASGVTVITATHEGARYGMTAASFSSLSLDPPLVLICVARSAYSHDGLVGAPGFAVHILGAEQAEMSGLFSRAGADKFDGLVQGTGAFDAPLLPFGVARLVCERHSTLDGGDHTILVGRVVSTELAGTDPLIYCNRAYGRLR